MLDQLPQEIASAVAVYLPPESFLRLPLLSRRARSSFSGFPEDLGFALQNIRNLLCLDIDRSAVGRARSPSVANVHHRLAMKSSADSLASSNSSMSNLDPSAPPSFVILGDNAAPPQPIFEPEFPGLIPPSCLRYFLPSILPTSYRAAIILLFGFTDLTLQLLLPSLNLALLDAIPKLPVAITVTQPPTPTHALNHNKQAEARLQKLLALSRPNPDASRVADAIGMALYHRDARLRTRRDEPATAAPPSPVLAPPQPFRPQRHQAFNAPPPPHPDTLLMRFCVHVDDLATLKRLEKFHRADLQERAGDDEVSIKAPVESGSRLTTVAEEALAVDEIKHVVGKEAIAFRKDSVDEGNGDKEDDGIMGFDVEKEEDVVVVLEEPEEDPVDGDAKVADRRKESGDGDDAKTLDEDAQDESGNGKLPAAEAFAKIAFEISDLGGGADDGVETAPDISQRHQADRNTADELKPTKVSTNAEQAADAVDGRKEKDLTVNTDLKEAPAKRKPTYTFPYHLLLKPCVISESFLILHYLVSTHNGETPERASKRSEETAGEPLSPEDLADFVFVEKFIHESKAALDLAVAFGNAKANPLPPGAPPCAPPGPAQAPAGPPGGGPPGSPTFRPSSPIQDPSEPPSLLHQLLVCASRRGHDAVLSVLLMLRAALHLTVTPTALLEASSNGHERCVELLVGDPTFPENRAVDPAHNGNEALRRSVERGHVEVVRVLLAQGEHVNPADREDHCLIWACVNDHVEILSMLLATGRVDPAARRSLGLCSAARGGFLTV
ncbi:hypothetical protein HK101_001046, partial [Irineochytrium annulatum]